MIKKLIPFFVLALLLSGCGLPASPTSVPVAPPTSIPTNTPTAVPPTNTPLPTATATVPPTPDLQTIGLPSEAAGTVVYDFVEQMCAAQWYVENQQLPCPGDPNQTPAGYVVRQFGNVKGIPDNIPMMLTYPPIDHYSKIYSKYPTFTVQKGDRFRAVTACSAHTFCDVQFFLNYFSDNNSRYLNRWHYLFTKDPMVIDIPLDSLAGKTVQFDLTVVALSSQPQMSAVWIAPHIYRPLP